uniref:tRNA (adenine(58)-N(1))-methyltransferase n=1 Tax=Arcella intermedia TaxID=1963864 RepID=A0A6B2LC00_9EUKA
MVIVYCSSQHIDTLYVTQNMTYDSKYGHYFHSSFVGVEYGSKVFDHTGKGNYIYLLRPTPELWTLAMNHRTEILYSGDISLILLQLEIKPGSTVVESGTGSGSLSTAFARSLAPNGHLYTYEFHQERAEAAKVDFQKNKVDHLITVKCADACEDGFSDRPDGSVDAIFLDLPSPWLVAPNANKRLRANGKLCSFSPCIEQVQKMCESLTTSGFSEITTVECLVRNYEVKNIAEELEDEEEEEKKKKKKMKRKTPKQKPKSSKPDTVVFFPVPTSRGHTGYLTFATKLLSS